MTKVYVGTIPTPGDWTVAVQEFAEGDLVRSYLLPLRLDLARHSPDGFAWGYSGSGPAQLALAMLADALGDALAVRWYVSFLAEFISLVDKERPWEMNEHWIQQWLAERQAAESDDADVGG